MYIQELKGTIKRQISVKPWNNYSWSKLGGECSVQMYKNSLIRLCMTEKPFVHKKAYSKRKIKFYVSGGCCKN